MFGLVSELIGGLGLGGQVTTAVIVAGAGWYLWRVGAVASALASILSSAQAIGISVAIALAVAIALGWIDLSIASITSDVATAASKVPGVFRDLFGGVLP
ncbi:hypothetical protein [Natronomonas sp. LN261]|uniref:hypothetical protein n=1 Tax=Natronomonas sp. LN261 TaxID=2750669 RepID=UPI0015EECB99|nr:hypothetical protein [Natronomonas sp. LN261]